MRVLVVDDDTELCELLAEFLEPEGFQVEAVHDGLSGVERALTQEYSLIVLDVMLPRLGGFEALRRIRAGSTTATSANASQSNEASENVPVQTPVLMLTARGEESERITGLEIGADDYLAKPFNPRELLARMRAILRRARPSPERPSPETIETVASPQERRVRVGDVELDAGSRLARRGGQTLDLTGAEFDVLALLLRRAGQIVAREEIAIQVLERRLMPNDRSIDMHISNLRRKLGPHPSPSDSPPDTPATSAQEQSEGVERIKSVRGAGYVYTLPESE